MAILNINKPEEVKSRLFEMMSKVNKINLNEDYNQQQVENTRDNKEEISEDILNKSQEIEKRIDDDEKLHLVADHLDEAEHYFEKMTEQFPTDDRVQNMFKMLDSITRYMYKNFFNDITVKEMYPAEAKNEPDTTNIYEDHESFHESIDMPNKKEDNAKSETNPYLIFSRRTQNPNNVTHLPASDNLRVKDPEVDSIQELHTKELGDEDLKNAEEKLESGEYENNGGVGDNTNIEDLDIEQLIRGLNVEMEHTNDPAEALSIAVDHITENPVYYGDNQQDPQEMAQREAQEDAEKEVKKSPEDEELDEILGYKPMNVGDYSHGDKKYFKENFDFDHAELEYEKNPDLKTKLEKFKNLYTNWKQLQDQEKQEAFNLYKELRMDKFDKVC